jgi:hypothetical protein
MSDELKRKLRLIQEGSMSLKTEDSMDQLGDIDLDIDNLDPDFLAEMTIMLVEAEIGADKMPQFMTESAGMMVRDQLLTEDVTGKSYIVLSPQARRQKAINLMKLRMAREANDPRYKRLVIARQLVRSLLEHIRTDARYRGAEAIVRKLHFKLISNPEAAAAMKRAQSMKLA